MEWMELNPLKGLIYIGKMPPRVVPPSLKEVVSPRIFPSPFGRATPYLKELREGLG